MRFDVLTVGAAGPGDGATHLVGPRLQVPIEWDDNDGTDVTVWPATMLAVGIVSGPGVVEIGRIGQIDADVVVTDARVVVVGAKVGQCSGCFTGSDEAADGFGVFSDARVGRRKKARVLIGHVRFPWLSTVGASPRAGVRGDDRLRLTFGQKADGAERVLALDLTLPPGVDSLALAQDIVRRAARFRLEHADVLAFEAEAFEALTSAERLVPEAKQLAFYTMPTYESADPLTAYPELSRS
jgi:hypothetical protein